VCVLGSRRPKSLRIWFFKAVLRTPAAPLLIGEQVSLQGEMGKVGMALAVVSIWQVENCSSPASSRAQSEPWWSAALIKPPRLEA
jgi:hypothetical protein